MKLDSATEQARIGEKLGGTVAMIGGCQDWRMAGVALLWFFGIFRVLFC